MKNKKMLNGQLCQYSILRCRHTNTSYSWYKSQASKIYDIPSDFIDSNDDSGHVEDQEHKNKNATDPSKRKVICSPKYAL